MLPKITVPPCNNSTCGKNATTEIIIEHGRDGQTWEWEMVFACDWDADRIFKEALGNSDVRSVERRPLGE